MKKNTIMWLAIIAIGLFIIIGHNAALDIVCKVIAIALIAGAAFGIVSFVRSEKKSASEITSLLGSIIFLGIGLWILLNTTAFITFMNVVLGLIMIISGAMGLVRGLKDDRDMPTIVLSCIGMVLGLIIACSNAATTWFTILEGIGLLYSGITGLLSDRRNA